MSQSFRKLFPSLNRLQNQGVIRSKPQDFLVNELNQVEFSNQGEHWWLYLQKTNSNTIWVAKQLSKALSVPLRNVGYAGLKDRHAITRQWFSVQLPKHRNREQLQQQLPESLLVVDEKQHNRKLKTGFLQANQFIIVIRDIQGEWQNLEQNLKNIVQHGVPNYFAEQRFGRAMGNIEQAVAVLGGKQKSRDKKLKGLLISTARSHIFNSIVSARIKQQNWYQIIDGDLLQLDNSRSWFAAKPDEQQQNQQRLSQFDVHLSAALWGEDEVQSSGECAALENQIAAQFPEYLSGFKRFKVKQARRAMRLYPQQLQYHRQQPNRLEISFTLPPGGYATAVLNEILLTKQHENEIE